MEDWLGQFSGKPQDLIPETYMHITPGAQVYSQSKNSLIRVRFELFRNFCQWCNKELPHSKQKPVIQSKIQQEL